MLNLFKPLKMLQSESFKHKATSMQWNQWLKRILNSLLLALAIANSILRMKFSILSAVKLNVAVHLDIKVVSKKMNGVYAFKRNPLMEYYGLLLHFFCNTL